MREPIKRDGLYYLDVMIANRPDGGTVSQSASEALGVSKSAFHGGLVGTLGVAAAVGVATRSRSGVGLLLGIAAVGVASKLAFDYLEAPRYG